MQHIEFFLAVALLTSFVLYCRFGPSRLPRSLNMDPNSTVKLIAGVLAVVLVGIVILRRKGKKTKGDDDEF